MAIPTTYPNADPLSTSFAVPSQDQIAANEKFWTAYKNAQATAAQNCPSATNIPDWYTYHAAVIVSLPPVKAYDAAGVGANQAVFDASDWEWRNNPASGRNKVF